MTQGITNVCIKDLSKQHQEDKVLSLLLKEKDSTVTVNLTFKAS